MNNKHLKVMRAIFTDPIPANIVWHDIELLFINLGAEVKEGRGSRVRFDLNGEESVFHRPHPNKEATKPMVKSARKFLEIAGYTNDDL